MSWNGLKCVFSLFFLVTEARSHKPPLGHHNLTQSDEWNTKGESRFTGDTGGCRRRSEAGLQVASRARPRSQQQSVVFLTREQVPVSSSSQSRADNTHSTPSMVRYRMMLNNIHNIFLLTAPTTYSAFKQSVFVCESTPISPNVRC